MTRQRRSPLYLTAFACAALWAAAGPASAAGRERVDLSEVLDRAEAPRQREDVASIDDLLFHLVQDPLDVGAHINLGNLYERTGQPDLAERAYHRAIKVDDTHPIAWNNLGVLYLRRGDVRQAASCFKEAIDADAQYAVARYNLASIQDAQGDYDAALENYRIAILLRGDLTDVRSNPYVVGNPYLIPASLTSYLRTGPYARLTERAPDRLQEKYRGVAEAVKRPKP